MILNNNSALCQTITIASCPRTPQMAHLSLGVCEYGSAAMYFYVLELLVQILRCMCLTEQCCVPVDEVKSIRSVRFQKLQPLFVPHNIILEETHYSVVLK